MDLLWFPTGGGKTEAYLTLVAFLAIYRRLSAGDDPDQGDGVAAIMRYTLRLLTTQQFARAASVLLACEAIRRGHIPEAGVSRRELGHTPFSIGLWVGGEAVPNRVSDAACRTWGRAGPADAGNSSCSAPLAANRWLGSMTTGPTPFRCDAKMTNASCSIQRPLFLYGPWTKMCIGRGRRY